ncbi:MAG: hypothetical protein V4736_13140 [Bdellovibrionota bacterium]
MYLSLIITTAAILISSISHAQLENCQCIKNPKDCEVGVIECSMKTSHNGNTWEKVLTGKLVSGDDVNPEWGDGVRYEVDKINRLDMDVFAHACDNKTFNVYISTTAWKFLPPEYPTDASVGKRFTDVSFNSPGFTEKLVSDNGKLQLEVTCSGKSL